MADDRKMNLIISLRNNKQNMKEAGRLSKLLENIHKNVQNIGKGFEGKSGTKTLLKDIEKLKKEVNGVVGSFQNLSKGGTENVGKLQNKIVSLSKILNNLIKKARETKGSFKEFGDEAGDSLQNMQIVLSELTKTLAKGETSVEKLSSAESKLSSEVMKVSTSFQAQTTIVQKSITIYTKLEESLRRIQVLGEFRGTSLFKQELSSVKLYRKELEDLRLKLAQVTGEQLKVGDRVVSEKALKSLRQMGLAFDKVTVDAKELKAVLAEFRKFEKVTDRIRGTGKTREQFNQLKAVIVGTFERFDTEIDQSVTTIRKFNKEIDKGMAGVERAYADAGVSVERLEVLHQESFQGMANSLDKYIQEARKFNTTGEGFIQILKKEEAAMNKSKAKLDALKDAKYGLLAATRDLKNEVGTEARVQEAANVVHGIADDILKKEAEAYHIVANEAKEFATALMTTNGPLKALTQSTKKYKDDIQKLKIELEKLNSISKVTTRTQDVIEEELKLVGQMAKVTKLEIRKLVNTLHELKKGSDSAAIAKYTARLKVLGVQSGQTSEQIRTLRKELDHMQNALGDQARAMHRVSAEGFANMMVSQAAWMIGFAAIFGTLEAFKKALSSIVETQLAVARAMRTIRDESKSTADMQDFLTEAIDRTRMRLGATAEDVGEVLYQLGSAGLHLSEALAALDSTMDNIIGTEADMENITNMVAGVYNNFADQIIKLNGKVVTISNTFKALSTDVVEAATQVEKFKLINDLLVRTFDAHQAEMAQIRDGLKFMTQSAKAVNVTLTEQLGILATLHDHLIKAGAAGRGMRVIFSKMAKDSKQWESAFNIKIDPTQPLNFMKILEDISAQMTEGAWKAEDLGNIFKRLGLRGTEPFLILIKYIKELNGNIVDLKDNVEDAAGAMAKTRLDNLGDQARIAGIAIEVLIKNGLGPLATMMTTVVAGFNFIAKSVRTMNEVLGGLPAKIIVYATWAVLVVALTFAMKNLGGVISWVWTVLVKLVVLMKSFGTETLVTQVAVTGLSARLKTLGASFATAKAGATGLSGVMIGLRSMLSSFIVPAILIAISQLIMYMAQWRQRTEDEVKVLKFQEKTLIQNRDAIDSLIVKMSDSAEKGENWNQILAETARMLNVNADEYDNLGIEADLAKKRLEELRIEYEKLVQAQRAERLLAELKLIKDDISKLKEEANFSNLDFSFLDFVKAIVGVRKEVKITEYSMATLKEMLKSSVFSLVEVRKAWLASAERLKKLKDNLDAVTLALKGNNDSDVKRKYEETRKELDALIIVEKERVNVLGESYEALNKVADAQNKETGILSQGIEARRIALKYAEEVTVVNNELNISVKDLAHNEEILNSKVWSVTDAMKKQAKEYLALEKKVKTAYLEIEKFYLTLSKNEETIRNSNASYNVFSNKMKEIAKTLSDGSTSIGGLQTGLMKLKVAFEEVAKAQEVDIFLSKVQSMWLHLNSVRNAADPKMFDKFLKELVKLGKDGGAILKGLYKDVEKLTKYLLDLENVKIEIKLDGFRRELDSSATKADILKQHIDLLAAQGKKKSWEMEKAVRQYNKEMKITIGILKEQTQEYKDLAEAAVKRAEAAALTAEEAKTEADRLAALKLQDESLKEAIAAYTDMKKAIKDRYDAERLKVIETAKDKTKLSNEEIRKIGSIKDKQLKALEDVDKKIKIVEGDRASLQDTLAASAKSEIDIIKGLIDQINAAMAEVQALGKQGVKLNYKSISDAIVEANKLHDNLEREAVKIVRIKEVPDKGSSTNKYFGGIISKAAGGIVPARVTAGEGYISPDVVAKHRTALNILNSGRIPSAVPSMISRFAGPGGVDNVETQLPVGSYVISKRGMDAYDKSRGEGVQTFQEGGEVAPSPSSGSEPESIGSFTIVVSKEGGKKEFPITGKTSVLKDLKKELEEERLTRLH
jgi:TP901 family phage tail tape measure protein